MAQLSFCDRRWIVVLGVLGLFLGPVGQRSARADLFVIPAANAGTEGNSIYGLTGALTAQQEYGASLLAGLPHGAVIDGLRFRLDSSQTTGPSATETVSNFDIYLGPSAFAPGSLSSTTAANEGAGTVLARTGALTISANSYPGGGSPNPFGPLINFTTPFTYTGGDLLLTLSYSALPSGLLLDGQTGIVGTQERQDNGYNSATVSFNSPQYALIVQLDFTPPAAVPEPSAIVLLGTVLAGIAFRVRRIGRAKTR